MQLDSIFSFCDAKFIMWFNSIIRVKPNFFKFHKKDDHAASRIQVLSDIEESQNTLKVGWLHDKDRPKVQKKDDF